MIRVIVVSAAYVAAQPCPKDGRTLRAASCRIGAWGWYVQSWSLLHMLLRRCWPTSAAWGSSETLGVFKTPKVWS